MSSMKTSLLSRGSDKAATIQRKHIKSFMRGKCLPSVYAFVSYEKGKLEVFGFGPRCLMLSTEVRSQSNPN